MDIYQGGGMECVYFDGMEADIMAKDSINMSEDRRIYYDVIVKCPNCSVKNKFENS